MTSSGRPEESLRALAERRVQRPHTDTAELSAEEAARLVYELEVHREELEIQNEELRRAHVELQESRDRYADLFDFAPVGYMTLDADGNVVEANLTAATMLDVERSKLVGTRLAFRCDAGCRAEFRARLDEVMTVKEQLCCELTFACGGRACVFLLHMARIHSQGSDGAKAQCRLVMSDITARKRAEEELRIRDRSYDASPTGITITDARRPDHPIIYCNPAFERITGYLAAEVLGRNCRFLLGDDRNQPDLEQVRQAIDTCREVQALLRNYRKDGSMFWNHLHLAPVRDESGHLTHFVGIQNDVTQRIVAEQAAREKDRHLRSLAEALPVLISYLDAELRYRFCNAAHRDWFGVSPEDLDGRSIHETLGENLSDEFADHLADALERRDVTFECELTHQRKGTRHIQVMLVPDVGGDGTVLGIHTLCLDVTERKIVDLQNARRQAIAVKLERLTVEERDVYELLIQGKASKVIAHELEIGLRTAERRRQVILQKLEVESVPELVLELSDNQGLSHPAARKHLQ